MEPIKLDYEAMLSQSGWIRRLAHRLLADDPAEADDLAQDIWLRTLRRPPSEGSGSLRAWVRRVAGNLAIDRHRSKGREAAHGFIETTAPSTAEVVARAEEHRRLVEAVLAVNEPYRSTLLLRYFEELSAADIGRLHRIPEATVRTRIRRGLELLRNHLDAESGGEWRQGLALLVLVAPNRSTFLGGLLVMVKTKIVLAASAVVLVALLFAWWAGVEGGDAIDLRRDDVAGDVDPRTTATRSTVGSQTPEETDSPAGVAGMATEPPTEDDMGPRIDVPFYAVPRTVSTAGTSWRLEPRGPGSPYDFTVSIDGRASLPVGAWRLESRTVGWRAATAELEINPEVAPVWVTRIARLTVYVRDAAGTAITGANVTWVPGGMVSPVHEVRTDSGGSALLDDLPGPVGALHVRADGFAGEVVHILGERNEPVEVVLLGADANDGTTLTVLEAETREPIEGALVRIIGAGELGRTDRTGQARLAMSSRLEYHGVANVAVEAPGRIRGLLRRRDLLGDHTEVLLTRAAAATIEVVDAGGAPVPGARLLIVPADASLELTYGSAIPPVTGENGRVAVDLPRHVETSIRAVTPSGRTGESTVTAASDGVVLRIPITVGPRLLVRVQDGTGRALTSASARLQRRGSRNLSVRADEGGRITVADPGDVRSVIVSAPGFPSAELERQGVADASGELTVTLQGGHELAGRVVDPEGAAVPGVEVVLWFQQSLLSTSPQALRVRTPTSHPSWVRMNERTRRTISGADGSFRFRGVPEGTWLLQTQLPHRIDPNRRSLHDSDRRLVTVPAAGSIDFEIPGFRLVTLRVLDDVTSRPVLDFSLERRPRQNYRTDLHYRATWEGWLPATTETLVVAASGYHIRELELPESSKPLSLTVRLVPAEPMVVRLRGAAVRSLAGNSLSVVALGEATDAGGKPIEFFEWGKNFEIDADGSAAFSIPYAPGKPLHLSIRGHRLSPDRSEFRPGKSIAVAVTVKKR